jgi:hypothetical protein
LIAQRVPIVDHSQRPLRLLEQREVEIGFVQRGQIEERKRSVVAALSGAVRKLISIAVAPERISPGMILVEEDRAK